MCVPLYLMDGRTISWTYPTTIMTERREQIRAVALAVIMVVSVVAFGTIGAAGSFATATDEVQDVESAEIGPAVEELSGTGEVILRLSEEGDGTVGTLQDAREQTSAEQESVIETVSTIEGAEVRNSFWIANALLVEVDTEEVDVESDLATIEGVDTIHSNFEVRQPEPVDESPVFEAQQTQTTYGLEQVNAPQVWDQFDVAGEGVRVAVLDTGVDADHPDIELTEDGWAEFDEAGNERDTEPNDPNGHGTHVSGTVAGGDAAGFHIGVAPEAELMHGKVLDDGGTFAQILAGMEWAVAEDADVVSMSLGIPADEESVYEPAFVEPIRNANDFGTLVVTSSGNNGPGLTGSPANIYEAFSIGATDEYRGIAGFSSGELIHTQNVWDDPPEDWPAWYAVPDIAAPGVEVISAYPGGDYAALSGTSMAAPHVSGAVALLMSANPDVDPLEAQELLIEGSLHPDAPTDPDRRYGEGVLDVLESTTVAAADGGVEGEVTTDDDVIPESAVVDSDYGTVGVVDEEGEFELSLPDGEWTIEAGATEFGYGSDSATVTIEDGEMVEETLELDSILDVWHDPVWMESQPDVIEAGDSFVLELEVANADEWTVTLDDDVSNVSADNVSVELSGTEYALNETIEDLDEKLEFHPRFGAVAELTVHTSEDIEPGEFGLEHEFAGLDQERRLTTGPTDVMIDPEPASFEIVEADLDEVVSEDGLLATSVVVENTGDFTATQDVVYEVVGEQNQFVDTVMLQGGEQAEVEWVINAEALPRGEYPHQVFTQDDSVEGFFFVEGAAYGITELDAPDLVQAGEDLVVTAEIENFGEFAESQFAEYWFFYEDGQLMIDSQPIEVEAGETTSITFSTETDNLPRGTYTHAVDTPVDSADAEIEVEPAEEPDSPLAPYADDDGFVTAQGVLQAFADWQAGEIDAQLVLEVFAAWQDGESIYEDADDTLTDLGTPGSIPALG